MQGAGSAEQVGKGFRDRERLCSLQAHGLSGLGLVRMELRGREVTGSIYLQWNLETTDRGLNESGSHWLLKDTLCVLHPRSCLLTQRGQQ